MKGHALLDMSPGFARANPRDRGHRDPEPLGHSGNAPVASCGADEAHIVCGERREVVSFAASPRHWRPAPFRSHVGQVVSARSLEKVRRVAARRVVTTMAKAVSWPLAVCREPGDAVCKARLFPIPPDAVPAFVAGAPPLPALVRAASIDPTPKACDQSLVHGLNSLGRASAGDTARGRFVGAS